jgi:ubiquitin carboxyl-terminal hydrolase 8
LQHHTHQPDVNSSPRPLEFRRKIVHQAVRPNLVEPNTLMEKLLLKEQLEQEPQLLPVVEEHPVKLHYKQDVEALQPHGFVLVSRDTQLVDALAALMRVAEPHKATECVRLWYATPSPAPKATASGDNYELVDFVESTKSKQTVGNWVQCIYGQDRKSNLHVTDHREVTMLLETRRTVNIAWPRESLVLAKRLQVGDFVDAQDVAGNWFEAVVRHVQEHTATVHYVGWASKWDSTLKKSYDSADAEKVLRKVQPPAPLWSRTRRWRENLQVGDLVEVRDSSSMYQRPKWYQGEVKQIGKPNDPVRDTSCGAELEVYGEKRQPLLVLNRTQQILVQVEQEKTDKAGMPTDSPGEGDLAGGLTPQPPYLRWVNLYGEEVCELGTHLKHSDSRSPVTLRYDVDGQRKPVEVMKSHPSMGSGFMRESLRGNPPAPGSVGLHNLGNSCFLNSTVQCLNHIEPLTQFFLQDKYMKDLNRKNPLGSGGNVAMAYASLLKKMWGGEYSIMAPRILKKTVASFAPQFDNSYQHDCQEFCQFLMDGLHEDLNRVQIKPYVEELEGFGIDDEIAAIESWRKHLLRHDSIIVDHCQGMHRSHLTCPRCGRESIKFDVYSSISLPLVTTKNKSTIQLEDCLGKFMEGEQLDERNAWYCPRCRQHVCALKMIALWTVPDILILHLKRFTFDTCMTSGSMLRSKMDHKVEFPVEGLDLSKHILGPVDPDCPPVYRLFGVSEHTGPTANSGHYTATVRNSIDGRWYRYNDSHVGRTSGEASITGGAYLLFYQRKKGLSTWGGMHKMMVSRGIDPYGGLERDHEGFMKVKSKKKKSR